MLFLNIRVPYALKITVKKSLKIEKKIENTAECMFGKKKPLVTIIKTYF